MSGSDLTDTMNFYRDVGTPGIGAMTRVDDRIAWEIPLLEDVFRSRPPGPLLDLGAGDGRLALALGRRGHEVVGLDIVPEFVEFANGAAAAERLPCRFLCMDFFDIPSLAQSFSGAFMMWGSFRHVLEKDRQIALLNILKQSLVECGVVLVDVIDEDRLHHAPNLDNAYQQRQPGATDELVQVLHKPTGRCTTAYRFTEAILMDRFRACNFSDVNRIEIEQDRSRLAVAARR